MNKRCYECGKITNEGVSCNSFFIHDGNRYNRIPYIDENAHSCHDCNIYPNQFHHAGCDMERCPICGSQLIGCECFDHEEEE